MALFNFIKKRNKSENKNAQCKDYSFTTSNDDDLKNKIQQASNVLDYCTETSTLCKQCTNDKHNFIKAGEYNGKTIYRCDKCELKIQSPVLSKTIYKEYLGSYINGISHKWNDVDMHTEDIVSFTITFGDLPIVTARYDGNVIKIKNSINGSRDGWRSFPEGYFEEKTIKLSEEDKRKLHEQLRTLNFNSFITSPDTLSNIGACGFCISNKFLCHFSDGKGFECLSPDCDDFNALVKIVKSIIETETEPIGIEEVLCDTQETLWLCKKCGTGNKFNYMFCINCGTKRPW